MLSGDTSVLIANQAIPYQQVFIFTIWLKVRHALLFKVYPLLVLKLQVTTLFIFFLELSLCIT